MAGRLWERPLVAKIPKMMGSRWAVEIEGHEATIKRLEKLLGDSLRSESDSFISRLRDVPVLRTRRWDKVDKASVIEELGQVELALQQGLTKLAGGASPLSTGTVFELGPDESITSQTRRSANSVYVLSRDLEDELAFRHRLDVARQNDVLRGAIIELSGKPSWISLYKAVEYIEFHFGGEKELHSAFPARKAALKRIKRTAQSVRHRARAFADNYVPYDLIEAEAYIQSLLREIVSLIEPSIGRSPPESYLVPKVDYAADQVIGLKPLILVNGQDSEVAFVGDMLSIAEPE